MRTDCCTSVLVSYQYMYLLFRDSASYLLQCQCTVVLAIVHAEDLRTFRKMLLEKAEAVTFRRAVIVEDRKEPLYMIKQDGHYVHPASRPEYYSYCTWLSYRCTVGFSIPASECQYITYSCAAAAFGHTAETSFREENIECIERIFFTA